MRVCVRRAPAGAAVLAGAKGRVTPASVKGSEETAPTAGPAPELASDGGDPAPHGWWNLGSLGQAKGCPAD